jgi:microcystin-dependent protein
MGSSAFDPVVLADVRSVKNKITISGLTGDVLAVGDVIRYDPSDDKYLRAIATSETNSNFIGVIESIDATDMTVVYSGEISLPDSVMSLISGYTGAQVFYLSDANEGKMTTTPPSNPGSVIKPVIIVTGTVEDSNPVLGTVDGIVVNSIGSRIAGDSTVDLSDIQPVGSILAFAGNTSNIPIGWDICDGGFLGITAYADLYSALNDGKIYGFIETCTLNRVVNSGSGYLNADNIVGSKFYLTRSGNVNGIECTVLSGTVNATGTQVTDVSVFVNPLYVAGSSAGSYHNSELIAADLGRFYLSGGTPLDVVYSIASPTKTQFKKPDLRARFIIGDSRGLTGVEDSAFDSYTVGKNGGEEYHFLAESELPIHSHASEYTATIAGNATVSYSLSTNPAGSHTHSIRELSNVSITRTGTDTVLVPSNMAGTPIAGDGTHSHTASGSFSISTSQFVPQVNGTIENAGAGIPHNNVPQHVVAIWIIKTRKDSYAKILKLGPSGGGAVIARNTPKRWLRATSGAGCTVDISYGTWGISRIGLGDYRFTHDLLSELGTADQDKYIVEASVVKSGSGATQMFVANPYSLQGLTFGVRVYDIIGATHSDNFQYLCLTVYGGTTL